MIIAGAALSAKNHKTAMAGYCPVAYVEMNKAIKGDAQHQSTVGGDTYLFANADAKKMFDANPQKYTAAIQYGTYCATAMSMGKKVPSDMTLFSNHDGKTYFFSSADAKSMFDKEPVQFIGKADNAWKKIKK